MDALCRLQRIDLHSLRLFAAIAKEGSISRAAGRHHIAPSALSRRLADLEYALGAALLVRSRSGVLLTDTGRLVIERVDRVDEELRCLLAETASGKQLKERVRVHASHSVVCGVLPDLLAAFSPGHESIRIEIAEGSSAEVACACADGAADIGVGLELHSPVCEAMESWQLLADGLDVLLPSGHPLISKPELRFEHVAAFPVIGSNPGGALHQLLQERALAQDLKLDVRVTTTSFAAACRLAEAGMGLAIVPRSAIARGSLLEGIQQRPLAESWADRAVMIYAGRKQRGAGAAALLRHLRGSAARLLALRSASRNRWMLRESGLTLPETELRRSALTAS